MLLKRQRRQLRRRSQKEGDISLSLGLTTNQSIGKLAKRIRNTKVIPEPAPPRAPTQAPVKAPPATGILDDNIGFLERGLRYHYRLGLATFVVLFSVVIGWAVIMPLAGAVVVGGTFVVHSSAKKIQHPRGGVVGQIPVHDGSKVKEGDTLVVLDNTAAKAETTAVARQIDETSLRIARLTAERDRAAKLAPVKFLTPEDDHQKMVKSELDFFKARQQTQSNIHHLAQSRIAQLEKQMNALNAQLHTNKRQKDITQTELTGMETLFKKKIAPIQRLTPLQREKARLEGSDSVIISSEQETLNKVEEIKLQTQQSDQAFHAEVIHDLSEASGKLGQLLEQYIVVNQTLNRTNITAPVAGVVNELNVHTVGGVIAPGETLMTIIPDDDKLEVDVRLASDKIDQVNEGQRARVKLTAFERTIPDIEGSVSHISRDLVESKMGSYYAVRIAVDQHPLGMTLTPGMPAEVFIKTQDRTVVSFLLKPLTEQMGKIFIAR